MLSVLSVLAMHKRIDAGSIPTSRSELHFTLQANAREQPWALHYIDAALLFHSFYSLLGQQAI